ncbi:hypothetical protein BDV35DRAFT_369615 [Aspergillus flavus]|uniref:Uncharacterized protein n=1 Tax=Aspergillus flavus TaxID=5059 RepID=A0A5N6GI51_ASPFL|nr:hypothetical protein BDV35DRAFT_369615 [Aspergillus flavus]
MAAIYCQKKMTSIKHEVGAAFQLPVSRNSRDRLWSLIRLGICSPAHDCFVIMRSPSCATAYQV